MVLNKTLVKRIFGKVKQDKNIPYKFHLNAKAVNMNLINDLIKWAESYGIKIDIEEPFSHSNGITFIVRDYRVIELFSNACRGFIISDEESTHASMIEEKEKQKDNYGSRFIWVFYNELNDNYIAVPEHELTDDARAIIEEKGFELYADSVIEGNVKTYMTQMVPSARPAKFEVVPISLKDAKQFVNEHHRHHKSPQGHKFSVGLQVNDELIGVIIAGRPVSRHLDNGVTLEVTRCCVLEGFKNAVSQLYSSVCKAAKAFGYKKVITYTLVTEQGLSMKAVGFEKEVLSKGGSWNSASRNRKDKHPTIPKFRWVKTI